MSAAPGNAFTPETLRFLDDLAANNRRDWFNENKQRYEEQVLDPALHFIQAMQEPLAGFAPHFVARPTRVGGSLMRVYRDTRFARDKRPYKTNIGIQFRHEQAKNVHAPGYYVHIDTERCFLGVGMWQPESGPLRAIRERIAERSSEWSRVLGDAKFRRRFELGGESLSRPPRGFDAQHPMIDDIKRKSFIAVENLLPEDCLSPRFRQRVTTAFRAADAYMRFLCAAVDVPF